MVEAGDARHLTERGGGGGGHGRQAEEMTPVKGRGVIGGRARHAGNMFLWCLDDMETWTLLIDTMG